MSDSRIFGTKEYFAIALGYTKKAGSYKLCFWVKGKKMGSFTKGAELVYSLKAYNQFRNNKEKYYLPEFIKMTPTQIADFLITDLFVLRRSNKADKKEQYEKRIKFRLWFGSQFSNDGSDIILLYKDNEVIFVYVPPKKTTANSYSVSFDQFCNVFDEYNSYCKENKLLEQIA